MRIRQEELEQRLAKTSATSMSGSQDLPEISSSVHEYSEYLQRENTADSGWSMQVAFPISADLERSLIPEQRQSRLSLSAWLQATGPQPIEGDLQFEFLELHMMIRLAKGARINLRPLGLRVSDLTRKDSPSPFLHCVDGRNHNGNDWNAWIHKIQQSTPALAPTAAQHTIPHHPFIDILPFPGFRNGLLQALWRGNMADDELLELCLDIERGGLRLWGNASWEPMSFEATDCFVQKWARRFDFGTELIASSNSWRAQRGEGYLQVPWVGQQGSPYMPSPTRLSDLSIVQFLRADA